MCAPFFPLPKGDFYPEGSCSGLDNVSPKFMSIVNLFGNGVFADVFKVRIEMKSYWIMLGSLSNECP